jgi:hypothetical protein
MGSTPMATTDKQGEQEQGLDPVQLTQDDSQGRRHHHLTIVVSMVSSVIRYHRQPARSLRLLVFAASQTLQPSQLFAGMLCQSCRLVPVVTVTQCQLYPFALHLLHAILPSTYPHCSCLLILWSSRFCQCLHTNSFPNL